MDVKKAEKYLTKEKVRIKASVEEEDGEIKRMRILSHKIIRKKTLSEF